MTKIIAELCQNHNGDFSILKEMVHAASESGAAIVKIQSMLSKDLTHRPRFDFGDKDSLGKIKTIKRPFKTEYDRLKKLDLDDSMHYEFIELCKKYKVIAMTTIFSRSRLKFLETLTGLISNEKELKIFKIFQFGKTTQKYFLMTNIGIFISYKNPDNSYEITDLFLETTPGRLIFSTNFKNSISI